jgi:hypothetical protein
MDCRVKPGNDGPGFTGRRAGRGGHLLAGGPVTAPDWTAIDKPTKGRIGVKVINHLGDEVMKVFRVE